MDQKGIKAFVNAALSATQTHLTYPLHIIEIDEGIVFEDDTFQVEARRVSHGIPAYGYRVVEKDMPGSLKAEDLKRNRCKTWTFVSEVENGETVTLEDGRAIDGTDYLEPLKRENRCIFRRYPFVREYNKACQKCGCVSP